MTPPKDAITQARLKELLHYDPVTGIFTWRITRGGQPEGSRAGAVTSSGYLQISIDYKLYKAHRLAVLYMTGAWPKEMVDHEKGDRSDNRWERIREATRSQNGANSRARTSRGVKGVYAIQGGKFRAQIRVSYRLINLGTFPTKEEAAQAYASAAKQYFGAFARAA